LLSKLESENLLQKSWEDISKGVPEKYVPYISLDTLYDITLVVYDALMSSDQHKLGLVDLYLNEKIKKIGEYKFDIHASIRRTMVYNQMIAIKRIFDRIRNGRYDTLHLRESEKNIDKLEKSIAKIIKSGDLERAEKFKEYIGELNMNEFNHGKTGFDFRELCSYETVLLGFIHAMKK
jgi:hypothetical protein